MNKERLKLGNDDMFKTTCEGVGRACFKKEKERKLLPVP